MKSLEASMNAQAVRTEKLVADRLSEQLKDAQAQVARLGADLADVKKDKVPDPEQLRTAALQAAIDAANQRLAELQLNVKAMSDRNTRLSTQLDESRTAIAALQKQNRQAISEITETRGKLERSERIVMALQRQLQDRDERIKELEATRVADATPKEGQPVVATTKIAGTVTAVRGDLASINIGSAQGVVRGMKLYIYRDASFVGYLLVDEVDEGEAAGTITDKRLDPVAGDKVTNDLLK